MTLPHALRASACAIAVALAAAGCSSGDDDDTVYNQKPDFVGAVTLTVYDGQSDDLLTAGLGKTGLAGASPTVADPTAPTVAELRRLAIYNNYRALVDMSPKGGYGTLYGPNIDIAGNDTLGEGKIGGKEFLAYADDGTGKQNVTMMVQIPGNFDTKKACIVTATSSGSRGVYGAIGTAGDWGLKHGCAVAYTDKGSGTGLHDLASDTVTLQNGLRAGNAAAGTTSNFTALSPADAASFNATWPNRVAVKHAHSQQNPEASWGTQTLQAVQFAFYELNEQFGSTTANGTRVVLDKGNTIVIASSASNGAGAALAALEADTDGLIDGAAVSEPNVAVAPNAALTIVSGAGTVTGSARPLYDYFTQANLLQPCASQSPRAAASPGLAFVTPAIAANRCASLKAKGILSSSGVAAQADEALDLLLAYGWLPDSTLLHASLYAFATPAIAMTYSNSYSRASVTANLCGLSFAATDATGKPTAFPAASLAQYFGVANGVPPSAPVNIINNDSVGGAVNSVVSVSPSTGLADFNIDGALCQRALWTGSDANATALRNGVNATIRNANLRGKPAIIVHGRNDGLIPVPFSSRPYYGQNKLTEGASSKLVYVEVTNAQHFDTFIDNAALPGYDSMFVPLHVYFIQAMDQLYANLTQGTALPPSQVVHTVPRGGTPGAAPAITSANVPPIQANPAVSARITFSNGTLTIPD